MGETLYASFGDPSLAEKAAGALLDYGVKKDDLSLVLHESSARAFDDRATREYAVEDVNAGRADMPVEDVTGRTDVPVTVPPYVGLESNATSASGFSGYAPSAGSGVGALATPAAPARSDLDPMLDDENEGLERDAKSGLSTTTPADAEAGALKGAGVGLGLGVIAGLASLFIPGVGLVTGSGMLAAAIGAAAGTTVAGAVAGGVVGYLKDQGVPEEAVSRYQGDIERGGAVIAVRLPSGKVDEATARQVLAKYSANNVALY